MARFPLGMLTLLIVSVLIYFGIGQRVLDRLRLSDRAALGIIAAIVIGSFFDIPISSRLSINVGGVIPIILAVWVLAGAGRTFERVRAVLAAVVTGLILYFAGRVLGADPEEIFIDPIYIYPIVAGIVGYIAGRSRRGAFFAAVMGVFFLDVGHYVWLVRTGTPGLVDLGGGGAFDALILSGFLAVLLAEGIGEILERLQGGPRVDDRAEELVKNLREPQPEAARKPLPDDRKEGEDNA
ncbi:MAG: DUF1614 domain-containing protein [Candidatus Saccharibacteria bacterium]